MRRELKIRAPAHKIIDIEYKLKTSKLNLFEEFEDRTVNSIYLDDVYLNSMNENIQGIAVRSKWRLRWYNDWVGKASLEKKQKFGYVGTKQNYHVDLGSDVHSYITQKRAIENQLPRKVFTQISHLEPKVKVSYNRSYWRSNFYDVRLTVDEDVRYYRTNKFRKFGDEIPLNRDIEVLLEIKYPDSNEDIITDLLSDLNLITTRNSKYTRAASRSL